MFQSTELAEIRVYAGYKQCHWLLRGPDMGDDLTITVIGEEIRLTT